MLYHMLRSDVHNVNIRRKSLDAALPCHCKEYVAIGLNAYSPSKITLECTTFRRLGRFLLHKMLNMFYDLCCVSEVSKLTSLLSQF